jgi:hypothetical protein
MAIILIPAEMVSDQGRHGAWTPIPQPPPLKAPSSGGKWGEPAENLWDQEWGSVPTQQWLTLPSWPQSCGSASAPSFWRPSWEQGDKVAKTARDNHEPRGCSAGELADVPDDELPSIGSRGHAEGTCKRCAFFSKGRCQNGRDCSHCHYPHEERKRYRKRGQRASERQEAADEAPRREACPCPDEDFLEELEEEEEEQLRRMMVQGLQGGVPLCSPCAGADVEADTAAPSGADTEDFVTPRRSSAASDCGSGSPVAEQAEQAASPEPPCTPTRRKESSSAASSPAVSPLRDVEFDAAAEQVSRTARCLLNKITEEKFESISAQILLLPLETTAQLAALVSEIFRSATSQRAFLPLYAEVCVRLDAQLAKDASSPTGGKTFTKALVTECQFSFEKYMHKAHPDAEQLEGLGYEDRYAEESTMKEARLGNLRFIGELLVRGLIASKVLLAIMSELLAGNEDDVESLVALLSVVGPHFDRKNVTVRSASVHETFKGLEKRASEKSSEKALSQRVRFQICDLLEARERGWAKKRAA